MEDGSFYHGLVALELIKNMKEPARHTLSKMTQEETLTSSFVVRGESERRHSAPLAELSA